jgi:hypothetical protein
LAGGYQSGFGVASVELDGPVRIRHDRTVLLGRADGTLLGRSLADGAERFRYVADAGITVPPAVVDGEIFLVDSSGTVTVLGHTDRTPTKTATPTQATPPTTRLPTTDAATTRPPTDDPGDPETPTTSPTPDGGGPNTTPPDQGGDQGGLDDTATPTDTSSGAGPGFGVLGALASLGVAGWRLRNREGSE